MSSSSSSSSSLDSTANSFTNSAWDVQKANRPVEGKPTLGMGHGIGNPDDADDGEHHRHLLKKRIYPTIFTYPTQKSTSEGPNEPVQETPLPNKKTDLEAAVLADCINSNFLFAHLEQDKQQVILEAFEKVKIRKNEIIFRQGDPADYCYMLFQGEVRIEDEHGTEVQPSGEKYEVLGELELLTASPHVNTVKATSASIIFRLGRVHFQRAISPPEVLTDSIEERIQILKRACPSELLEYLEDDETALKKLVSGMTTRTFSKGDVLYQNNGFVIISEGLAIASMEGKGYEDLSIGPGEAQTSYGWRMFASEARVERRIVASTDGKALIITKEAFANAFGNHGGAPLLQHLATKRLARIQLQQIAVFKDSELDDKQINGLLDLMHHCEYSHSVDEIIMKAGEKVEPAMYFVREGCVTLEMNRGQTKQTIAKGSFFGEKNMLLDQNKDGQKHFKIRAIMTAIAHPNTKVDILYLEECRKVVNTRLLGLGKPAPVSAIDASIQWADLRRHKMLGAGSFGQVWLASVPDQDGSDETGDKRRIVALKVQAKHQLVESSQAARVVAERNILASLHSPFIIRLYSTFQDDGLLYMITSLLQGGELESLIPQDGLSESATKFYAAGILEGLSYMHRHHIIHRDVKPGNILIDEKGYPVLIDLGFGKRKNGALRICKPTDYILYCFLPSFLSPQQNTSRIRLTLGAARLC